MFDEHVPFFEGVRVEEHVNALASSELAALMLRINPVLTAAETGERTLFFKLFNDFTHDPFSRISQTQHSKGNGGKFNFLQAADPPKSNGTAAVKHAQVQEPGEPRR
ncbi:MAG: hypothetical protein ACXW3U_10335 [Rhodoplanes sp.]